MPGDHHDPIVGTGSVNGDAASANGSRQPVEKGDSPSRQNRSAGENSLVRKGQSPFSTGPFRRHREMLGLATVVIGLSCLLEVRSDQRVALRWLPDYPLPETCLSRSLFHIECP